MAAGRLRPARDVFFGRLVDRRLCHGSARADRSLDLQQLAFFVLDQLVDLVACTGGWSCRDPSRRG